MKVENERYFLINDEKLQTKNYSTVTEQLLQIRAINVNNFKMKELIDHHTYNRYYVILPRNISIGKCQDI